MNVEQEFTQEEIQRRAEENSELFHNTKTVLWAGQPIILESNGSFEFIEPEESYWW